MPNGNGALDPKIHKRQTPPFWWPDTQSVLQLFLALSVVGMVAYILQQLLSGEALKIDPSVRDLIVFIFGIIFGNFKDVYGFTYGSSAGAKNKDDTIKQSLDSKDKIIAEGVVTAAALSAGGTSTEAMKAALVVAPGAAAVAAPPAAEVSAPPAAKAAVADALKGLEDELKNSKETKGDGK